MESPARSNRSPAFPPRAPASARTRLLKAALAELGAHDTRDVTLDEIRIKAGVSVGALYHHFPDKSALATALYIEVLAGFQAGFVDALRRATSARAGVVGGVVFYLHWVSSNRAGATVLLGERPPAVSLEAQNRAFFGEVIAWWKTHVHYGMLRELPFDVLHALWLGPSHEYGRHWLAGRSKRVPTAIADVLGEAAWQALAAPHPRSRRSFKEQT